MWHNYPLFVLTPGMKVVLVILVIWSIIWKGVALWKAARNNQTAWYVLMLIINTAGILEIIYILGFSHKKHIHE
jgi:methionyl-tRNA synthetase